MRNTFIVLGKLMGLLMLYIVIAGIGYFLPSIAASLPKGTSGEGGFWMALGSVIYLALLTILAFLMIFKAEKVANWVGLREDEDVGRFPSAEATLLAGMALIGIYIMVRTLPEFVAYLLQMPAYSVMFGILPSINDFVGYGLRMALGLFLILKPRAVARFIARRTRVRQEPQVSDETPR